MPTGTKAFQNFADFGGIVLIFKVRGGDRRNLKNLHVQLRMLQDAEP